MNANGIFIAIEGIDGAGSSTQCQKLYDFLKEQKQKVILTAQPSKKVIGRYVRELLAAQNYSQLLHHEILALLFAADRLDHYRDEIYPNLQNGVHVICDRYVLSSLVYQGLVLEQKWIEELNRFAPCADYNLFIDVDVKIAQERLLQRASIREVFDDSKTQHKVRAKYLDIVQGHNCAVIDGNQSENKVFANLIHALKSHPLTRKIIHV